MKTPEEKSEIRNPKSETNPNPEPEPRSQPAPVDTSSGGGNPAPAPQVPQAAETPAAQDEPKPSTPAPAKPEPIALSPILGTVDVLSDAEQIELYACEEVIGTGWSTFVQVGLALARIRNGRLYRTEFCSFEAYCPPVEARDAVPNSGK